MANIMINKICNAQCPYCFANKFVNQSSCKDENNMTLENFKRALEFCTKGCSPSSIERIGIIGGEPTLHPELKDFMQLMFDDKRIQHITLFTNGINLEPYRNILANNKITTLINLNSPNDIGAKSYERILNNIEYLINQMFIKDKISIGINMYKPDFDYQYMLDILKKYKFTRVRTSIVVPNTSGKKEVDIFDYFKSMKPRVFEFFAELQKIGVMPTYDCNLMPQCILSPEETQWLEEFWKFEQGNPGIRCNITDNPVCSPVIDILPNLETVRCFGCSNNKTNIWNFDNVRDLTNYFQNEIDIYSDMIPATEKCTNCYYRRTKKCTGGCIAFKEKKIEKAKEYFAKEYGKYGQ